MKKSGHSKFNYHTTWTQEVKNELGASYVSWENNKGKYSLIIGLETTDGEKRKLNIPINGTPMDTTPEHYMELIKKLKNADREI